MDQHETRGGRLCSEVYDVSTSEGGTPKAHRTLTTVGDSRMEMRLSFHGLCSGSTTNLEEKQRDLGHHGSTHDGSPLHSYEERMDLRSVGLCLCRADSPIIWSAEFYSFRSGHQILIWILIEAAGGIRDTVTF